MNRFSSVVLAIFCAMVMGSGCDQPKKAVKNQPPLAKSAQASVVTTPEAATAQDNQPLPAGVLVKVGNWSMTQDEFSERIKGVKSMVKDFDETKPGSLAMLLNELIRQQLLIQLARQDKLQETKEVQAAMKDFEGTLLVQEVVARLTKDVEVSGEEARKYYDDKPNEFKKPMEKQLREIVTATQAEANDILVQVLQGGDFAQIAKEKSKGKTKENGGDLGYKTDAPFQAMAVAVSTLKKGGVSSVFEGPEGFYIAKVEDVRGGETVSFPEVRADLLKFLKLRKQQQVLADKIKEAQGHIKVQVNQDLLKAGTGE